IDLDATYGAADGEGGGASAAAATGDDLDLEEGGGEEGELEGDGEDGENNMSLAAMEEALKPAVLETLSQITAIYKKLAKLQEARFEQQMASDELSSPQQRKLEKMHQEVVELVKSLRFNNARIEALVEQL